MKPKIGFVDDDRFYALRWIDHLDELFDVVYFRSAGDAYAYVSRHTDLRCLVVDVMMPTPSGVSDAVTGDGMLTGVWLLKELEQYIQAYPLPVIILTNRSLEPVQEAVNELDFPEGLINVYRKIDTSRSRLRDLIVKQVTTVHGG